MDIQQGPGNQPNGAEGTSFVGGDSGTRTRNLGDANAALSQLSYIPTQRDYSRWSV